MKTSRWLAVLLCAAPAFATTMLAMDVPMMSKSATAIVQGRVVSQKARWTGDHSRIVTDVELQVLETIKGATPSSVTLIQLGGEVDDVGQHVEGGASFHVGDEVLVFLQQQGPRYLLVGMSQGKFDVQRSADGKAAYAVPDLAANALLLDPVTRQPRAWGGATYQLDQLKADIRAALVNPVIPATPSRPVITK